MCFLLGLRNSYKNVTKTGAVQLLKDLNTKQSLIKMQQVCSADGIQCTVTREKPTSIKRISSQTQDNLLKEHTSYNKGPDIALQECSQKFLFCSYKCILLPHIQPQIKKNVHLSKCHPYASKECRQLSSPTGRRVMFIWVTLFTMQTAYRYVL